MVNRVLVVDDEQTLAGNIQDYLVLQGLDVHVAHDGASAIGAAERTRPEVVVLDYRLPDMEGFQVLEAVRQQGTRCHFVLITAHPTAEVRERASQLGVSHILFKPFPLAELARAVLDLMGIKRESRRAADKDTGFVERRQSRSESFPLQLFDGSWVLADRRRNGARPPGPDDDQLLTGE
ncbi:response regulator [Pseudomonas sp. 2(2015)]|uniref:response regulator n=1 Tax=Pseudomonas sp. 2(2015) TaxID=1619950 RepID=UPI0005EB1DB4|nr:response regulator [Pseudomonas sp. 2(2015)]KJK17094.1 chemotaxis protein CheY [Pseudomonas sp. 2(2015)]